MQEDSQELENDQVYPQDATISTNHFSLPLDFFHFLRRLSYNWISIRIDVLRDRLSDSPIVTAVCTPKPLATHRRDISSGLRTNWRNANVVYC